jgi:hypothetical protein
MSRRLDLASSWAKVRHGARLKIELSQSIARWSRSRTEPPIRFRKELETEHHAVCYSIATLKPVNPDWSLVLGDALNNYRAALDHLAWQLYRTGNAYPLSPSKELLVTFPRYATNRQDFLARATLKELPGVSRRRLLRLSPFQPYSRPDRSDEQVPHAISELVRLTNADKHRELLVTVNRPLSVELKRTKGIGAQRVEWLIHPGQRLEPGADVVRVYAWPGVTLDVQVRMYPEFTPQIALEQGTWLRQLLDSIDRSVRHILHVMERP